MKLFKSKKGVVWVTALGRVALAAAAFFGLGIVKEGKEAVEAVEIGGGIGGIPIVVFVILGILLITFMRR